VTIHSYQLEVLKTTSKGVNHAKDQELLHPKSTPKMGVVVDIVFSEIVFAEAFVFFFSITPKRPFLFSSSSG